MRGILEHPLFWGVPNKIPILTWNGASQNEDQESSCGLNPNIEYA